MDSCWKLVGSGLKQVCFQRSKSFAHLVAVTVWIHPETSCNPLSGCAFCGGGYEYTWLTASVVNIQIDTVSSGMTSPFSKMHGERKQAEDSNNTSGLHQGRQSFSPVITVLIFWFIPQICSEVMSLYAVIVRISNPINAASVISTDTVTLWLLYDKHHTHLKHAHFGSVARTYTK